MAFPKVERIGENFIVRGVPIFDEHQDDSRPDALKRVDASKLDAICKATNTRLATEYELPLATDWHTPKPGEKHTPPPVKGGYRNLRVEDFHGRKAIYADLRVPANEWKAVQPLQRRSVEIFADSLELDTLCLLGSKAPSRDLGPLTYPAQYDRSKGACVRYEMTNGADEVQTMDGEPQETEVGFNATQMQQLAAMIKGALKECLDESLAEGEPGDGMEDPMADEGMQAELPGGDEGPVMEDDGAPTGDLPPVEEDEKEKYARMHRRDETVRYERQQAELKAMKAELAAIKKREVSERYERKLAEMQAEGYAIDSAKIHARVMNLPTDAHRDEMIETVRETARKSTPAFYGRVDHTHREDPTEFRGATNKLNGQLTKDQAEETLRYAKQHGVTYDAAKKQVLNGVS